MYAPVAIRIHTYQLDVGPVVKTWMQTLLAHPLMQEWYALAEAEPAEWRLSYEDK